MPSKFKVPALLKNPQFLGYLVLGGAAIYIVWRFRKATAQQDQGEIAGKDVIKLTGSGIKASYPDSAYVGFADKINSAGVGGFGTDESAIYAVFEAMKNDLDVVKLVAAFGNRRMEFTAGWTGLGGWLRSELNTSEMSKVNSILAAKGISYRF